MLAAACVVAVCWHAYHGLPANHRLGPVQLLGLLGPLAGVLLAPLTLLQTDLWPSRLCFDSPHLAPVSALTRYH